MATQSTGAGFSAAEAGGSVGVPESGAAGQVGLTPGSVAAVSTTEQGHADYTVIVQVPVPFVNLNLNLDLVGAFAMPILTAVGVPKAMQYLLGNAANMIKNVIDDATLLISAIPDATFTIQVKVGPAVIYSVQLVAEKQPMVITPPTFQLALPNFSVNAALSVGLPGGASTIIKVPIPVPIYDPVPLLGISGGQVSAGASAEVVPGQSGSGAIAGAGASGGGGAALGPSIAIPTPTVTNPISLPHI